MTGAGPGAERVRPVDPRRVEAVLAHARTLLRHAARPTRPEERGWPEPGELDLDATIERPRPWLPEDVRVVHSLPRDVDLVAVLDLSLSITAETLALVATAAAVLRLRLERLGVVAFDTRARLLVRVDEALPPREMVRRILAFSAEGYTNLEAGLAAAGKELRRSCRRDRAAIVLTDGLANVGRDPVIAARGLPRLHVVHLGGYHPQGSRTCAAMAEAGKGRLYRARTYADLPTVVRRAARELVR